MASSDFAAATAPQKPNAFLLRSSIIAAIGGLLFGFDTVVISGATQALTVTYRLTPWWLGFTVASGLIGTIFGAAVAGPAGDKWGRRDSQRGLAILYFVTALGCALAWNWGALIGFRVLAGIAIGGSSVLGPMYIAEISPGRWRGRLVGLFQFNIVTGILLAYLSNYLVGLGQFGSAEWRVKLGISAAPALLFLLGLFFIPRSPRWLVKQRKLNEAREVLRLTGETTYEEELQAIVRSIDEEHHRANEPLFRREYALPIFLAMSIGFFNQLTGINAILYYLNDIFAHAGFSKVSSDVQAVIIGAMNLLFTIVGLSLIDKAGRKTLLLIGAVGTGVALAGVAAVFFGYLPQKALLICLVVFIGFFAMSQGSVIWVYLSEVFPNRVRGKGQSLGSFSHWFMNAIISWTFPRMAEHSGGYPFLFFAVMMAAQFLVVLFVYPETKRATLEELQERMGIH
ncbi:MAG TPA: sugar porter family MFS transporter [Terriglobales bacterium]|nr:sugar porter family MFS transporter [Terriglobales bacterium]